MKEDLLKEVTEEELNSVIHHFQKGKIPGLDGFTLESFLRCYELIKLDVLKVVKESQRSEKILRAMNAIFITLIPKKQKWETSEYFRQISCYNLVYKIIAKIIAQRMKLILNKVILEEQFSFLFNKQIHDAVLSS